MSAAPAAISIDNVSKRYGESSAPVLDGVSLAVREREFLAVVGPSGSGKTTLLRLVNRLIDPSEGTVRVAGEDVQTVDPIALRRRIGYVFQGVGLFPHMTVAENIGITPSARLGEARPSRARRRADRAGPPRPRQRTATAFRTHSPAASASGSAWPARSRPARTSS